MKTNLELSRECRAQALEGVEPTFWLYELGDKKGVYLGVTGDKAKEIAIRARDHEMGDGPVFGLYSASTLIAAQARVADTE